MVKEEREQREKMPQYKGLEGFTLVEKMGDGAFSNVYKAVDKLSGQKVAGEFMADSDPRQFTWVEES